MQKAESRKIRGSLLSLRGPKGRSNLRLPRSAFRLLLTASCLLLTAFCLLPSPAFAKDAKQELVETKQTLQEASRRNQELSEQNKAYETKLMKLLDQAVQQDGEIKRLSKKLAAAMDAFKEKGLDSKSVDKSLDKAIGFQSQVLDQKDEIASLKEQRTKLEQELEKFQKAVDPSYVGKIEEENAGLRQELEKAQKALTSLQKGGIEQDQQIRALRQEKEKYLADLESVMKDIAAIQKQVEDEKALAASKIKEAEDRAAALQKTLEEKEARILALEKEGLKAVPRPERSKGGKGKEAGENLEKLKEQNEQYAQALQQGVEAVAQLKGQQSDAEEALKEAYKLYEKQIEELKYDVRQLNSQIKSFQELIVLKDRKIQKLTESKAVAEKQVKSQREVAKDNQRLREQVEELRKQIELRKTGETKDIENTLVAKEKKIETLQKQIEELHALHQKDRVTYFYNLGLIYTTHGLVKEALEVYQKALQIDPNDAAIHYNLIHLYEERIKDPVKAKEHREAYQKLSEGKPVGEKADWLPSLLEEEKISLKEDELKARVRKRYPDLEDVDKTAGAVGTGLAAKPERPLPETWSDQLERANETQLDEIRKLRQRLREKAFGKKAKTSEGFEQIVTSRDEKIRQLKEKVEELDELRKQSEVTFYYNLGVVYAMNGLYTEAVEAYKKALKADPQDASSHYNLGIIYEDHFNNIPKALRHYEAFERLSPDKRKVRQVGDWIKMMGTSYYGQSKRKTQTDSIRESYEKLFLTTAA